MDPLDVHLIDLNERGEPTQAPSVGFFALCAGGRSPKTRLCKITTRGYFALLGTYSSTHLHGIYAPPTMPRLFFSLGKCGRISDPLHVFCKVYLFLLLRAVLTSSLGHSKIVRSFPELPPLQDTSLQGCIGWGIDPLPNRPRHLPLSGGELRFSGNILYIRILCIFMLLL